MESVNIPMTKGMKIDDFTLLKVIGKGSYGTVMLSKKKDTQEVLAIKMLKKSYIQKRKQEDHTKTERYVLGEVKHPFIIQMKYAFQNKEKLYFALEYCPGGELFYHLQKVGEFDEDVAKFYAAQLVLVIGHLHEHDIIYRDLKPENVLIAQDGYVKVADFGLSKAEIKGDKDAKSFCGTPEYLAPEILKKKGYGKAVDWWMLGSMIYEMLVGLPPFYLKEREKLFKAIANMEPEYPSDLSSE